MKFILNSKKAKKTVTIIISITLSIIFVMSNLLMFHLNRNINIKHNFYAYWLEGTLIDIKNIINEWIKFFS